MAPQAAEKVMTANQSRVPRVLFWIACALAALLILLVITTPWMTVSKPRWLSLFANDATLRRTAIASALGILVTACVFFRPAPR